MPLRRWLGVPAQYLVSHAQQLERPMPSMIYVEDEHELASPYTGRNHWQASDMDVLAALSPLSLPGLLDLLAEFEEVLDIGLRERHATVFNMLGARPADPLERRHNAQLARILARTQP
jgi:hypothetical protein